LKEVLGAGGDGVLSPKEWERLEKWCTKDFKILENVVAVEEVAYEHDTVIEGRTLVRDCTGGGELFVKSRL
jgi:hypothetical protein